MRKKVLFSVTVLLIILVCALPVMSQTQDKAAQTQPDQQETQPQPQQTPSPQQEAQPAQQQATSQQETQPPQEAQPPGPPASPKVNINVADAAQLTELPGIGPSTAQAIIQHRESKGSFKAVEHIQDVSGIGPKKFEAIKNLISVE